MAVTLRFQSTGSIPGTGHPVQMRGNSLTIGRADENDLVLPDPDKTLSKRHCVIEDHNGNVVVVDISSNGTFLNYGKIALGPTPTPLNNGDILTIGPYEVLVDISSAQDSGNVIPDPLVEGPVSHGSAAAAPSASDLLDAPGDGVDFLDDLLSGREGPVGHRGVNREEPDEDGLLPPLGPDDPLLPPAGADEYTGPAQAYHNPSATDHFLGADTTSGGGIIPDDWDDDFFAPTQPAAPAQPAAPPQAAPPQPMPASAGTDPATADPLGADPLGADPLEAYPLGADPLGEDPLGADPLGADPLGADPLGADPLGADPLGADPLGAVPPDADPLAQADPLAASAAQPQTQPQPAPPQQPVPQPAPVPQAAVEPPQPTASPAAAAPPAPGSAGDPFGEEGDSRPPIAGVGRQQVEDEFDIAPDPLDDIDLADFPEDGGETSAPVAAPAADPVPSVTEPASPTPSGFGAEAGSEGDTVVPAQDTLPEDQTAVPAQPATPHPAPEPSDAATPAPQAAPPAMPAPATVVSAPPGAATDAFLKALGADEVRIDPADTVHTMSRLGHVLRIMIEGIREILMTRTSIKSEFRIEQTRISAGGNNPLKFSISPEQAIEAMVKTKAKGYLDAADAADQALKDIKAHEVAMVSGMEAALKGVLAKLDPAELEGKIEAGGGIGGMLKSKKARYWEVYEKMYAEISDQAENEFHELFAKEFARAYQEQLEKLK
ncbi:MAG: type VI secretion system-associated FHA domain protein TagH [Pseudomonadota bacterium]